MLKTFSRTLFKVPKLNYWRQTPNLMHFAEDKKLDQSRYLTTNQVVSRNVGLNRFLTRVYNTTALAFGGALASSYIAISVPTYQAVALPLALAGLIASFVGFFAVQRIPADFVTSVQRLNAEEKIKIVRAVNNPLRQAMFALGVIGLGFGSAPIIAYATAINPTIVPTCIGLTLAIFGGASLTAYNMRKDAMLKYGRVLLGSLMGLAAFQLLTLTSTYLFGLNSFFYMSYDFTNIFAMGLFPLLVLYDTHVAMKKYELGTPDHLSIVTQLLLNAWNIFITLLRMFTRNDRR